MGAKASTEQRPRTYSGSDPTTSGGGGGGGTTAAVSTNNGASSSAGAGGGGAGNSSGHHHHHHHHHHHSSFRSGNNSNGAGGGAGVIGGGGFSASSGSSSSSALLQGNPPQGRILKIQRPSTSAVRARSYSSSAVHSSQTAGIIELGSRINSFASGLWPISGVKCPICNKSVLPDDIEVHLVMCLTRPRLNYNEDFLEESKGDECVICLEELEAGQVIARLPCLCVYHKHCIDEWFQINRSCPEHPNN